MSARARRTAIGDLTALTDTAFDDGSVIGFKGCQAGVEQFAFGDDHDVKTRRDLITAENLTYQSFSAISLNGPTEFPRRCNP